MKVAIIEGGEVGGTCVNRGCVPSKALLAASGRIRDMRNASHLKQLGIQVRRRRHRLWLCSVADDDGIMTMGWGRGAYV